MIQPSPYNSNQHPQANASGYPSVAPHSNTQVYGNNPQNVQPNPQSPPPPQAETSPPPPKRRRLKSSRYSGLISVLQIVVGAILAAVFINTVIFQSYEVVGDSMLPTLHDGDRLIINKLGKSWSTLWGDEHIPKHGDIVVFNSPTDDGRQLVKRVIGIPGDTVVVDQGVITVYNEENPQGFNPDEAYSDSITVDTNYSLQSVVGPGELFVAGDNRVGGASFDSRNDLGLVPVDNVVGELILRLLPLSEARFF